MTNLICKIFGHPVDAGWKTNEDCSAWMYKCRRCKSIIIEEVTITPINNNRDKKSAYKASCKSDEAILGAWLLMVCVWAVIFLLLAVLT